MGSLKLREDLEALRWWTPTTVLFCPSVFLESKDFLCMLYALTLPGTNFPSMVIPLGGVYRGMVPATGG